jgi:hypothetical protein
MLGGKSCCSSHQAAAALPYSYNSLFGSSPSKVGQSSFEYCLLSHKTSSSIRFHSLRQLTSVLLGRFNILPPALLLVLDYNSLFMLFSFLGVGIQSAQGLPCMTFLGVG